MRIMWATAAAVLSAALGGCGGGGGNDEHPDPVASDATFAVRAAMDGIATSGVNLNLSGKDNAPRTVNSNSFNDWTGTFSLGGRTPPADFAARFPNCAGAARLVDIRLILVRVRDGYRLQEGATFAYSSDFKPICSALLDGHYWTWNFSAPLPVSSKLRGNLSGIEFTGAVSNTIEPLDIDSDLSSLVGLDADTAGSAWLSFVNHVVDPLLPPGFALPYRMFGEWTEFRYRIDAAGKFLGVQYVRTGLLADRNGGLPVTIVMTSK